MADVRNFLLGQGEQYTDSVIIKRGGGPKKPVYSFSEAKKRLTPRIVEAAKIIASLPQAACPGDEAVAVATLHHEYLSKSSYPETLIQATGLRAIGSRTVVHTPEKVSTTKGPQPKSTSELFLAGPRKTFDSFAGQIRTLMPSSELAEDIIKIEDFRAPTVDERILPIKSKDATPQLEIVLHSGDGAARDRLLNSFRDYLDTIGIKVNLADRIDAGNLSFLSIRARTAQVRDIAKFSFLRKVREMPRLRPLMPKEASKSKRIAGYDLSIPTGPVLDPTIRVAVFDGGFPDVPKLARYVDQYEEHVSGAIDTFEAHGLAVTSALLFGPLEKGVIPQTPYAKVDHYRVLDADTQNDPQHELYPVLRRIVGVLEREKYEFVNLSIGPDIPLDDDDVHPWTATLDPLLSGGGTLATLAVGNAGEADAATKLNKIQPPSDCVNGLSVGACDSRNTKWNRAGYSSVGHGRCPGLIKPDGLAFGGTNDNPFWVIDYKDNESSAPVCGTSFASPYVLNTAIGVRAYLGPSITPLTLKALLIHNCSRDKSQKIDEVGWGRIETDVDSLITCASSKTCVLYQGTLSPRKYLRARIPLPPMPLIGPIKITATVCFSCGTDPDHPVHYTRNGLEIIFRPDINTIPPNRSTPATMSFFGSMTGSPELVLRQDAHKWETVRHESIILDKKEKLEQLKAPAFDIHCHPREAGRDAGTRLADIPYGMVVSIEAPNMPNAYDRIVAGYPKLRPIVPRIQTRIRN